jgi:parvulin-like peptidyl-prolyl isomerase
MRRKTRVATAAMGLGLIGWSGAVRSDDAPADSVVLTVNGESVMQSEYIERLQRLRANDFIVSANPLRVRSENAGLLVLNALIVERLTLQWAVKTGQMPKEEEITGELERFKQQPAVTQALQNGQVTEKQLRYTVTVQKAQFNISTTGLSVSAKEMEDWYKAHPALFTTPDRWNLNAIVTSKQADVAKIQAALKAGKAFEAVAKQYSEETRTKANGGDLGLVQSNAPLLPEAIKAAARTLKLNEVSAPIKTDVQVEAGKPKQVLWWFLRVKSREPGVARPFGDVKEFVERQALLEKAGGTQAGEKKIAEFRKTAAIKVFLPVYKSLENAGS